MEGKEVIINTANTTRVFLWFFVIFIILCILGVPALVNLEIEPLKDNLWITLIYMLFDSVAFPGSEIFPDAIMPAGGQLSLFLILFIALTVTFGTLVWNIDRLFKQYALGNVFAPQSIKHFFIIGWSLIALFLLNTLGDNLIENLYLPGEFVGEIVNENQALIVEGQDLVVGDVEAIFSSFISLDFSLLLAGTFVVAVARVMQLGAKLQDDVDATV